MIFEKKIVVKDLQKKKVQIEEKNQYTLNVELGSTRTEIKYWVEGLFGVKVRGMNSHRLLQKGRRMGWDLVWDIECITSV